MNHPSTFEEAMKATELRNKMSQGEILTYCENEPTYTFVEKYSTHFGCRKKFLMICPHPGNFDETINTLKYFF
jgi:hypothetical protein